LAATLSTKTFTKGADVFGSRVGGCGEGKGREDFGFGQSSGRDCEAALFAIEAWNKRRKGTVSEECGQDDENDHDCGEDAIVMEFVLAWTERVLASTLVRRGRRSSKRRRRWDNGGLDPWRERERYLAGDWAGDICERGRFGVDDAGDGGGEAVGLKAARRPAFRRDETERKKCRSVRRRDAAGGLRGPLGGRPPEASGPMLLVASSGLLSRAAGAQKSRIFTRLPAGEHDVFGLDVAVDDAFFVGRPAAFATLGGDGKKFVRRNGRVRRCVAFRLQRTHDEPEFAAVLEDVIDTANVGMVQSGGALAFLSRRCGRRRVSWPGAHALMATKRFQRGISAP